MLLNTKRCILGSSDAASVFLLVLGFLCCWFPLVLLIRAVFSILHCHFILLLRFSLLLFSCASVLLPFAAALSFCAAPAPLCAAHHPDLDHHAGGHSLAQCFFFWGRIAHIIKQAEIAVDSKHANQTERSIITNCCVCLLLLCVAHLFVSTGRLEARAASKAGSCAFEL